jgi:hypothetical protein
VKSLVFLVITQGSLQFRTDVSGQPIGPIFKGPEVQEELLFDFLILED